MAIARPAPSELTSRLFRISSENDENGDHRIIVSIDVDAIDGRNQTEWIEARAMMLSLMNLYAGRLVDSVDTAYFEGKIAAQSGATTT